MAIDHEMHKIRVKAVSDKMNHPMEYNDAGAPKQDFVKRDSKFQEKMKKMGDKDKMSSSSDEVPWERRIGKA